jgi:hypothetical protein
MSTTIKDKDGLYYPYTHVRDETWLKATLLYFPHILRMVAPEFEPHDGATVKTLTEEKGSRGEPLLGSYNLKSLAILDAVDRLTHRLVDDIRTNPAFAQQFSRDATANAYGDRDSGFLIFRGKAPQRFWKELTETGLMWHPPKRALYSMTRYYTRADPEEWAALHPRLGEAFMATVAAAAAQDMGLEIVTDASFVHAMAASGDEETIYETLIHGRPRSEASEPEMMLRRLAHLIIVGGFDVSELSPKDLAAMSKNREALSAFRQYLSERVAEIPEMDNEAKRDARLKAAAIEALDKWRKSLANMSSFARRFFGVGLLDKSEKAMTDLVKAMIPGSLTAAVVTSTTTTAAAADAGAAALVDSPVVLAAAPGLVVALAVYGIKTWRGLKQEEMSGPLRYLSLLKKQGATLLVAAPPQREDVPATA